MQLADRAPGTGSNLLKWSPDLKSRMKGTSILEPLEDFVEVLRQELQQYGEMLARFDDLDEIKRRGARPAMVVEAVEDQAKIIRATRRLRIEVERRLALQRPASRIEPRGRGKQFTSNLSAAGAGARRRECGIAWANPTTGWPTK
jgi:hypothetical protein